jgi:hypothetical protein
VAEADNAIFFRTSQHKAFLARFRMFVVEHRGSPGSRAQRLEG